MPLTMWPRLLLFALLLSACRDSFDGKVARRTDASTRADLNTPAPPPPPEPPNPLAIGPGSDEAPAKPLTPEQSLPFVPEHARDRGYAAEVGSIHSETLEALAKKYDRNGPTELGLLVCRARTTKRVDADKWFWDAPDLDLEIRAFGLNVNHSGPEDRRNVIFTLPMVSLRGGEVISVHMRDRDAPGHFDEVGTVKAKFDGKLPLAVTEGPNTLACSHLPQPQVEVLVKEAIENADKALSKLVEELKVDPLYDDLGVAEVVRVCEQQSSNIAALVTWGDPRVQRRIEWCQRIERKLSEDAAVYARAAIARVAEVTAVKLPAQKTRLEIGRPQLDCQARALDKALKRFEIQRDKSLKPYRCVMRVPARNIGTEPFLYSTVSALINPVMHLTVISDAGRTESTGLIGVEDGIYTQFHKGLLPGTQGTLIFPASEQAGRLIQLTADSETPNEFVLMLLGTL